MAILTVIPEEMDAALLSLGATEEVGRGGHFTSPASLACGLHSLPFVVARCTDRSNTPAGNRARDLMEDWRPEVLILSGIAGGIQRIERTPQGQQRLEGPALGDVVVAQMVHFGDYGKDMPDGFLPRFLPLVHPPGVLVMRQFEWLRTKPDWSISIVEPRPAPGSSRLHMGELIAVEAIAGNPLSDRQQAWLGTFDKAIAVDMESMGVARALHDYESIEGVHYHPRWLCIRGISDAVAGTKEAAALLPNNSAQRDDWKAYASAVAAHVTQVTVGRLTRQLRPEYPAQPAIPAWAMTP